MMEKKFYFVGIKGSGMSSLAQILHDSGYQVEGSDIDERVFTQEGLEKRGIAIHSFSDKNITGEHTYIIGNAFDETNEEVRKIKQCGYKATSYFAFLGAWMERYISIGVSGAHGKTSTSCLLAHLLKHTRPSSALIGDGTGYGANNAQYFTFEACEYKRHFLAYKPDYAIITNIDFDHPDYFTGLDDVVDAFETFASQTKKKVVVCGDDVEAKKLSKRGNTYVTYGIGSDNDISAANIEIDPEITAFDVIVSGEFKGRVAIPLHGTHAIQNTLAVLAVCLLEGLELQELTPHLMTFKGAKRRFNTEVWRDNVIVNDYAHHPKEILATIETARQKYPSKEIVAIFQPHTFSRTAMFMDEFALALNKADKVFGCEIFGSAREQTGDVTIENILSNIKDSDVLSIENVTKLNDHTNSVFLFMGAGDIEKYIEAYKLEAEQKISA